MNRYADFGGLETIAPMLFPNGEAVAAVLTLYLIESGANICVGRTLDCECIEPSDVECHRRITGHKARARGKPIVIDLPDSSPAIRAIDWLIAASNRLRVPGMTDFDRLFLVRIGERTQLITPHGYTAHFKRLVMSTPGLHGVALLPSMIRPSVLLQITLGHEGRLVIAQATGQHSLGVTQGYQQKWPTRLLYDSNIKRFSTAFETLIVSGVEDAAGKLGISVESFEARLGNLRATGLGTFCKDQRGRPGEKTGTCSSLDCWNDCPQVFVVAEVNAIATLQLWQASLRAVMPEWERDRPERWDQIWLPWLCFTDVVEEKMTRGPLIKIWNSATRRAAGLSARPGYVPPHPW